MISIALSHRPHGSSPSRSFIMSALMDFRRSRARAAQRRHLLSLDDKLLRDMGLTRLDVLNGDF